MRLRKIRSILTSDLALFDKIKYFGRILTQHRTYRLKGGAVIRLREGSTDWKVFDEIFIERVYESYAPDSALGVIVDLGANIGLSAIFLLWKFPESRMVAVEPDAGNFAMLLENVRAAGLAGRCTAIQAFAGVERGFAELQDSGNGAWGLRMGPQSSSGIPVIPLTELAPGLEISILKCDIEGSERQLFQRIADWEHLVRFIILELHADLFPVEEFLGCLRASAFDWRIHGEISKNSCLSVIALERLSLRSTSLSVTSRC